MEFLRVGLNDLNYWLVLLAAVVAMAAGAVWYSESLFAGRWRKEVGMSKKDWQNTEGMAVMMIRGLILSLVTQSVLYGLILASDTTKAWDAVVFAFVLGLAFSFTSIAINNQYQRKSMTLTAIDSGYILLTLVLGALIFIAWG